MRLVGVGEVSHPSTGDDEIANSFSVAVPAFEQISQMNGAKFVFGSPHLALARRNQRNVIDRMARNRLSSRPGNDKRAAIKPLRASGGNNALGTGTSALDDCASRDVCLQQLEW